MLLLYQGMENKCCSKHDSCEFILYTPSYSESPSSHSKKDVDRGGERLVREAGVAQCRHERKEQSPGP